jgi:hypothetical protein
MHQGRIDFERLLQLFNTHGTEIAPGSDVVGKDFQCDRLVHMILLAQEYVIPESGVKRSDLNSSSRRRPGSIFPLFRASRAIALPRPARRLRAAEPWAPACAGEDRLGARRRTFGFGLLPIPLLERRLQRTQFIPIHRVLIRPLRRWATSNAAALARDFSLRDLRRDQPGVERVALKVLRAGDTHAPGF